MDNDEIKSVRLHGVMHIEGAGQVGPDLHEKATRLRDLKYEVTPLGVRMTGMGAPPGGKPFKILIPFSMVSVIQYKL